VCLPIGPILPEFNGAAIVAPHIRVFSSGSDGRPFSGASSGLTENSPVLSSSLVPASVDVQQHLAAEEPLGLVLALGEVAGLR
jgi:hypothetical protein